MAAADAAGAHTTKGQPWHAGLHDHIVENNAARLAALNQLLAAYLFSRSKTARQQLIERSQSGSVVFNDVIVQAGVPGLPFGGVGPSGIGRCHGEVGFRSLSNQKSVYQRPFALDLAWRYPPYGNRLSLLKRLLG